MKIKEPCDVTSDDVKEASTLLKDPRSWVRFESMIWLMHYRKTGLVAHDLLRKIALLIYDKDWWVQNKAVGMLGQMPDDILIPVSVELVLRKNTNLLNHLKIESPEALRGICRKLIENNQGPALYTLVVWYGPQFTPEIVQDMVTYAESSDTNRLHVLKAMLKLPPDTLFPHVEMLQLAASDSNEHVRTCAINSLGRVGSPEFIAVFANALEDTLYVKIEAMDALIRQQRNPEAANHISRCLREGNRDMIIRLLVSPFRHSDQIDEQLKEIIRGNKTDLDIKQLYDRYTMSGGREEPPPLSPPPGALPTATFV